jgi:hypothetical protein
MTIEQRIGELLRLHQYENQCAAWHCDCGEWFGPGKRLPSGQCDYSPPYEGSDDAWADHVTKLVLAVLQPDIDAIAEAICNSYASDSESLARWKFQGPFGRQVPRRAARAAVEAWMGQHD